MELKDLSVLGTEVQNRFRKHFNHQDVQLPVDFKAALTAINSDKIEYLDYSLIVHSPSSLKIYIPNQWIFIAYYFVNFYLMLREYREKVVSICGGKIDKDEIQSCQNNKDKANSLLNSHNYNEQDRNYIINFLSDYSWWNGGKTIDRLDFYVSPILQLAGLVNTSQSYISVICKILAENSIAYNILDNFIKSGEHEPGSVPALSINLIDKDKLEYNNHLAAMRTKPFLLLAGISGTGKSRIVKEMAFASCHPSLRKDNVTPGNYCMIEVKPNWHDSTELIGYVSSIPKPHYVVTPFVNFLIKAMHNPETPFFVCLDEMNLAPVEQYFAEFLSVLESRKLDKGVIVSEPIIKADYTKAYIDNFFEAYTGKKQEFDSVYDGATSDPDIQYMSAVFNDIKENGLRLPPNVVVIGTVNMDETTYQFSRKVIDRAMTIEMNEVRFDSMFDDTEDTLKYRDPYVRAEYFLPKYTAAKDALAALKVRNGDDGDLKYLKENVPIILKSLDATLANTPFRIAYRVENELILYFASLREEQPEEKADALLSSAVDDILMMKVLPRIEGNEDVLTEPLNRLQNFTSENYPKAHDKVKEMQTRLEANHFTSFWP